MTEKNSIPDLYALFFESEELGSAVRKYRIKNGGDMPPYTFGQVCFEAGFTMGAGAAQAERERASDKTGGPIDSEARKVLVG